MISEATKISIAMQLIEEKIARCMVKKRSEKSEETKEEYNKLLIKREEIYKGNHEIINEIIKEAGEKKND